MLLRSVSPIEEAIALTEDPQPAAAARLTRGQLVRRAATAGAGIVLLDGVGFLGGAARLLDTDADAFAATTAGSSDVRRFVSRPDLRPPSLTVLRSGSTGEGSLFIAPSSGPGERGVLILDNRGDVVWFHPTTPHTAMNFRTGRYHGEPVLTWWEGKADLGLGRGTHVILDQSYRVVARLPAGGGRQSDLHEFLLTPQNTALVTSYEVRSADLSAVGGPVGGQVIGGVVQELALPSGHVLFEWRSLDHVAVAETHAIYTGHPLDYFHVNSIDLTSDGNLLVSARNTWGVYKVSRTTGEVLWRLGGKRSDFVMGKGTVFAWQHDARHHGDDLISIFDDGAAPQVQPQSRALVIRLDGKRGRATLVREYTHHPGRIVSKFMGNAQVLGNGNVVVGWGSEPFLTEFSPEGTILLDLKLPHGGQNYRAFRFPWVGRPFTRPTLVYRFARGIGTVYASWNGATEVTHWQLLAGARAGDLAAQDEPVPKRGFETTIATPRGMRFGAVAALDRHGKVLGRSETIRI